MAGNLRNHLSAWETVLQGHPKADELYGYLSSGVDISDFFVHFKGNYQGRSYDSSFPPRVTFPNARRCLDFEQFISSCIVERVSNGSLLVLGEVGAVDPPHLVMPITVEPTKPRMCHDERFPSLWIKDCPFSLDYITNLPRYVGINHFQTTIDDKSGYDHVPLHPHSRTFFGLEWKGFYFVYATLPFGWKASAYIYHTIGMAAISHIRSMGVPSSNYIDDKHLGQLHTLRSSSYKYSNYQLSEMATFIACSILLQLGYFLGLKKCSLTPALKVKYLGYFSESDKQAFTLPPDKVNRFAALRDNILSHKTVAFKTLQKFAGKTTSFSLLLPGAKLYTNVAYQAISRASRSHKPIPVSPALKAELLHWKFLDSWDGFLPWKDERHTFVTIFSDASNIGWGAVVRIPGKEEQHLRGYWDESSWESQVSRTSAPSQVLQCIFQLSFRLNVALKVCFVASALNPADLPSRALSDTDCKLSPLAWKLVQRSYGPHTLDLFALTSNVQCDQHGNPLRFFAPFPNPGCSGVNVFTQTISPSEMLTPSHPSSSWVHSSSSSLLCPAPSLLLLQIFDLVSIGGQFSETRRPVTLKSVPKARQTFFFSQILTSMSPSLHALYNGIFGSSVYLSADCSFSSPSTASSCSTSPLVSFGPTSGVQTPQ